MLRTNLLSFGTLALLAATATAQNCALNQFPMRMVDAQGVPVPTTIDGNGNPTAHFATETVYAAFDANLPSGTYYVHVTDDLGGGIDDQVLSTNDPMDRFVTVTNTNGVISLSLPYTNNPNPVFGVGLNGVGQSLLLPVRSSATEPCTFNVYLGDYWELSMGSNWPYIVRAEFNTTLGRCPIFSFHRFLIGDGNGSDVSGNVFLDSDRDGVRDVGESPVAGAEVRLVTGQTWISAATDASGHYVFADVFATNYSVEVVLASGFIASTPASQTLEVCGCANVAISDFGVAPAMLACNGHSVGYWHHQQGLARVQQLGILATLPALWLRNMCGQRVAPGSLTTFRWYLQAANSWNMAYMLSAQLLAMHCNVMAGFVDPNCVIHDQHLGDITIANLMQQAVASLCAHGSTWPCSPHRQAQARLKNALDNANNNRNWR